MQGQAGPDVPPEPVQVHVDQQPAVVVQDPLTADLGPPVGGSPLQPERPRGADTVGGQVDAGPGGLPGRGPVDASGSDPARRSARARARPAKPAPTTRTRSCSMWTNRGI